MRVVAAAESTTNSAELVRDLVALTKPRITTMVLVTTAGGLGLAPGELSWQKHLLTILATGLVVSAASTLNNYLERDTDALMNRTRRRPLAAGRLAPQVALAFGLLLAALSIPALTFFVHPLPGLLAFIAFVSYVWLYTPMKRMSTDALLVGAVPGAMPPLIGWTAVTGALDLPGLVLFSILFVWQLPHFLAIALYCAEDYGRGGHKVFPLVRGEAATKRWTVIWSVAQLAVSLLLLPLGVAGWFYGVAAALSGSAYLAFAIYGLGRDLGRNWSRRLMLGSILYLCVIFFALAIDSWL
ncbi:heme o synthase [Vulgatibacter sp.]|uniref:heme o synthase n=1 Tax=Vulgatibacter sp. TaxID=1971226 RepID=UPI00356997A7